MQRIGFMTTKTSAETPEPFPSIETPTKSRTDGHPAEPSTAAPSYRELERKLVPLPDSSHRPLPNEAAAAELPREPTVSVTGGDGAFPAADTVKAAVAGLDHLDGTDLQLDVVGGTVTMTGSVARAIDRDRIITALERVHGVAEVRDQLRIRLD